MSLERKAKKPKQVRKKSGRESAARVQEAETGKRVLGKIKAPPSQGFPAAAPGSRAPDEHVPGTRERGSPDQPQGEGAKGSVKGATKRTGQMG
jgi:hypothetical protein